MAGFENQTNAKRVQKIIDILDLLEHSRQSNRATVSQMAELLRPVLNRLDDIETTDDKVLRGLTNLNEQTPDAVEPSERLQSSIKQLNAGNWSAADLTGVQIRDVATAAPLKELLYAVAVMMNRVSETLDDSNVCVTANKENAGADQ